MMVQNAALKKGCAVFMLPQPRVQFISDEQLSDDSYGHIHNCHQ